MKYLIVGLGNPNIEYSETRHNIGFKILDALVKASGIVYKHKRFADVAQYKFKGRMYVLIKPMTFMNLSGKAVNYRLQKEKIPLERMLVIVDDIALPIGTIRIKSKGSAGGHNGLEDIIKTLGNQNFARLRFGIGKDFYKGEQVNYVLGKWTEKELNILPIRINKAVEAVKNFGTIGIQRTMNLFNEKIYLLDAEKKENGKSHEKE